MSKQTLSTYLLSYPNKAHKCYCFQQELLCAIQEMNETKTKELYKPVVWINSNTHGLVAIIEVFNQQNRLNKSASIVHYIEV